MTTIQTSKITPSAIIPSVIPGVKPVAAPVRGPGRPAGGKDWMAAANNGSLPDFQFDNLGAVIASLPLLGKIKKTLPVFLPLPEQMAIIGAAIASGEPAQFQAAMFEASKPTGTAEITLAEYAKTNNSATVEKEEMADLLTAFCASVRKTAALHDKRVRAFVAEKTAEENKNKEAADALENEADADANEDEVNESEQGSDDAPEGDDAEDDAAE